MSETPKLVFLHGLESGPHGSKYRALVDILGVHAVLAPSFEGILDPDIRVAIAEQATRGMTDLIIVGSSFGGLVACLLASRHPERIAGMVLMAPALHDRWAGPVSGITRVPPSTVIVHGLRDEVVPVEASRWFAGKWPGVVELAEVDDGHRPAHHRHHMVELVRELLVHRRG